MWSMLLILASAVLAEESADVRELTELSIGELLSQKKSLERAKPSGIDRVRAKGHHRAAPERKTYYEYDDYDEEEWLPKKRKKSAVKSKFSKMFEVSVTTLSFLAFGSYLLCLMVNVMRHRTTDALAAVGTTVSPQMLFQQILAAANKPYPIRLPTTSSYAIHSGRRKRRSTTHRRGNRGSPAVLRP